MKYININTILFIVIPFLFLSCSSERESAGEKYPELIEAENLFQSAFNYSGREKTQYFEQSAIVLELFLDTHDIDNAYVYYNLGNSWFKADQLGKAILNYRKAERRKPSNSNIKNNLSFARSMVIDKAETPAVNPLVRTIFFLHFELSFKCRVIILLVLVFITFSCLTLRLYGMKRGTRNIIISVSVLMILVVISLAIDITAKDEGVIIISEITARKGDSNGYDSSFTAPLHEGVEFKLISTRAGWYQIELFDGRQGWIPEYAAQIID